MTQHLLAALNDIPLPEGFRSIGLRQGNALQEISDSLFPGAKHVVKIALIDAELDQVVDQARNEVLDGAELESTRLGALLFHLSERPCEFALFWGSDATDLPSVSSRAELWRVIEPQLLAEIGNWELHVRYTSRPPAAGV